MKKQEADLLGHPRQRIIDTAIQLFFEQGYSATGVNQIITQSQACKDTFYRNFPSKEDLCLVYIEESHNRWMKLFNQFVDQESNAMKRLLSVFDFLEEWMKGCSYRGCGLMNIAGEIPDLQSRLRDKVQERNQILKGAIKLLVEELSKSDQTYQSLPVDQITEYLFIIVQGSIAASQVEKALEPIEAAKESFIRVLKTYTS